MGVASAHNLSFPQREQPRPYGVRVSLKTGDPIRKILGPDWSRTHWYATAVQRDAAMQEMSRTHEYSRAGDSPALRFERVEKLAESRGL